jgi:hypothetical protein
VVRSDGDGGFHLDALVGAQVRAIELNVRVVMRFYTPVDADEPVATLALCEPFQIFDGDRHHGAYFGPPRDGPPYGLDVLARLVQATTTRGIALASGDLEVEFSNGWRIDVPFGAQYEAWEFYSSDGWLVSPPGGGL